MSNIPQLEKVNFKVRYWYKKKKKERKDTGVKPVVVGWAELSLYPTPALWFPMWFSGWLRGEAGYPPSPSPAPHDQTQGGS